MITKIIEKIINEFEAFTGFALAVWLFALAVNPVFFKKMSPIIAVLVMTNVIMYVYSQGHKGN